MVLPSRTALATTFPGTIPPNRLAVADISAGLGRKSGRQEGAERKPAPPAGRAAGGLQRLAGRGRGDFPAVPTEAVEGHGGVSRASGTTRLFSPIKWQGDKVADAP